MTNDIFKKLAMWASSRLLLVFSCWGVVNHSFFKFFSPTYLKSALLCVILNGSQNSSTGGIDIKNLGKGEGGPWRIMKLATCSFMHAAGARLTYRENLFQNNPWPHRNNMAAICVL